MANGKPILVIVGPTASGKTALAIALAKKYDGEVISADSRQVYRGLTIGTGKVTHEEMDGVPHHLLDVADPRRTYTAKKFMRDASKAILDIQKRGKLPIIAGGTGFYIDALFGRITLGLADPDQKLRALLEKKTTPQLHALLKKVDIRRFEDITAKNELNNRVRLIRAIEIAKDKKKEIRNKKKVKTMEPFRNEIWIGIQVPREELRAKITKRLHERLNAGMIEEVEQLHKDGLSWKRMEALGLEYRFIARYLQKKLTRSEMETLLDTAIWQYARRQIAYWKRNKDIKWIAPTDIQTISKHVSSSVSKIHE
jgi:tRNA dimethylallyltransferase